MSGHTPGPWATAGRHGLCNIATLSGRGICSTGGYSDGKDATYLENIANAAFIVRACNNHDALLEALKQAVEWDGCDSEGVDAVWLEQARAAIAAATGDGS